MPFTHIKNLFGSVSSRSELNLENEPSYEVSKLHAELDKANRTIADLEARRNALKLRSRDEYDDSQDWYTTDSSSLSASPPRGLYCEMDDLSLVFQATPYKASAPIPSRQ